MLSSMTKTNPVGYVIRFALLIVSALRDKFTPQNAVVIFYRDLCSTSLVEFPKFSSNPCATQWCFGQMHGKDFFIGGYMA